jgi:hypothetical protein
MKKIFSFLLALTTCLGLSVNAQTADEIINKNIDAIGGKDAISKTTSLYMEGSMQVMGNEAPTTVTVLAGKGYKSETDFNGQKSIQCYTDKGGWAVNPMAGGTAQPIPEEQYKANRQQINIGGALFDYAAKGFTATLLGNDGNNYKIKLVGSDQTETTYYIDAGSYYVSKVERKGNIQGQDIQIVITFADYKKIDAGLVVPHSMSMDFGQFQLAANYTKIEVNKKIDPAVFEMPK